MPSRAKALPVQTVRIIRDVRDARLDYRISAIVARGLETSGFLYFLPDCNGYMFRQDARRKRVELEVRQ